MRTRNGCSGKRRYRDGIAAKVALAKVQHQDKAGHVERRAYQCPVCKGWHLTSQAVRGVKGER